MVRTEQPRLCKADLKGVTAQQSTRVLVARETKPASAGTESTCSEVLTRGGCTCVYLDRVFEILGFLKLFHFSEMIGRAVQIGNSEINVCTVDMLKTMCWWGIRWDILREAIESQNNNRFFIPRHWECPTEHELHAYVRTGISTGGCWKDWGCMANKLTVLRKRIKAQMQSQHGCQDSWHKHCW